METIHYPVIKEVTLAAIHKLHRTNQVVYEITETEPGKFCSRISPATHHAFFNDHKSGLLAEAYLVAVMRQNIWPICHQFREIPLKSPATGSVMEWEFFKKLSFIPGRGLLEVITVLRGPDEIKPGIDTYESESMVYCETGTCIARFYGMFHISEEKLDQEKEKVAFGETPPVGQLVNPAELGMFNPKSVLISDPVVEESGGKVNLAINLEQSFYFEHYGLHVSGPMLMEAGRQAVIYLLQKKFGFSGGYLKNFRITFAQFVTLKHPVELEIQWKAPVKGCGQTTIETTVLCRQNNRIMNRMSGRAVF